MTFTKDRTIKNNVYSNTTITMKKIYKIGFISFLILTFGLRYSQAQNQNYLPMVNSGAMWFETYSTMPSPFGYNSAGKKYLQGDTTINDLQYIKLYGIGVDVQCQDVIDGPWYLAAFREDTVEQKVWIVKKDEDEEKLYFDFTLEEGDTVPTDCFFSKNYSPITVFSVDTVTTYDDEDRRRWRFIIEGGIDNGSEVIEGIGSINGLLAGYIIPIEYYWEQIFCFTIDSTHIFPNPNPTECILPSDTCITVGIEPKLEQQRDFLIYPNPTSGLVTLSCKGLTQKLKISICDLLGKKHLEMETDREFTVIDISDLSPGIYYLNMESSTKETIIKKIIRQ